MYLNTLQQITESQLPIVVPDTSAMRSLNVALDYDAARRDAVTWQPPSIMSSSNFLEREFIQQVLEGERQIEAEFILSSEQENALWESIIAADPSLALQAPGQAAPLARAAWRLAHLWKLPLTLPAYASLDVQAFFRWSRAYIEKTAELGVLDQARLLARAVNGELGQRSFQAHGFIDPAPQLGDWFQHAGVVARSQERGELAAYQGHCFIDRGAEVRAALSWAAEVSAASPQARIAIVADGLAEDDLIIQRACNDIFGLRSADPSAIPDYYFHARNPLADAPLIRFALAVLELSPVCRWDLLSEVIRHPLLVGAETESAARAQFDAELRSLERYELPLPVVIDALSDNPACAKLRSFLLSLLECFQTIPQRQNFSSWLSHFEHCLNAAGWTPSGESLSSKTVLFNAWSAAGDRLITLDAVLGASSREGALSRLRGLLSDTVLSQPAPQRGIFLLEPKDALLIQPTHSWLIGCESDAFVGGSRLSPLLPLDQQREAQVPGSDPRQELWRARVMLETLVGSSVEAHASFAEGGGDMDLRPSPLLANLRELASAPSNNLVPCGWSQAPAEIDQVPDHDGVPLATADKLGGGVGVFAAQAACPFRAYARHRLAAAEITEPQPGVSARHKGIMVHRILARWWAEVGGYDELMAQSDEQRAASIKAAISRELLPLPLETDLERQLFFVERGRLLELLSRWLEYEATREPFTVAAVEQTVESNFAELKFSTRLDRADQLADGKVLIVDYKTGKTSARDWQPPRMDDPQLPFYALTAPFDNIAGVVFAHVDRAKPSWTALLDQDEEHGDVEGQLSWSETVAAWRQDLEALAAEIRAGEARLDPKRGAETCRFCEQALFCRRVEAFADGYPLASAADDDE